MLSIRWGLFLTIGVSFLFAFGSINTYRPDSFDPFIWTSYTACASLCISIGLSFIALTYLFSRGRRRFFAITCGMMGYAIVIGYLLNPFRLGDIVLSSIILGVLAAIEIAFVFTRGIMILESMGKTLYPDALD